MGVASDAVLVDNDKVDELMGKVADENGMELKQSARLENIPDIKQKETVDDEKEDKLAERLRALRG